MKKILSILLVVLMLLPLAIAGTVMISADEAAKVLYVKSGGAGDGSSEAKAFGDLFEAVDAAAALTENVDVVIVGTVNLKFDTTYNEPEHSNKITVRGQDENAKLSVETSGKVWNLGGELEIRDLHIHVATANKAFVFTTQFNLITFGYGITVTNDSGSPDDKALLTVRCVGTNTTKNFDEGKGVFTGDSTIIVKSGRFEDIAGFAQNGAKGNLEGTVRVYVGQNAIVNNLTICRSSVHTVTSAEIYLDGATIRRHAAVHDKSVSGLGDKKMGVTDTFKLVVTKNTDINAGWDHASPAGTLFQGFSGCSPSKDSAESHLDRANFILEAEASVLSAVTSSSKVRTSTFDEVKSIADGSGIPADIKAIVETGTPDSNYDGGASAPADTKAPAETEKAPATTKAPETTKAPAATKAPETTKAPVADTTADTAADTGAANDTDAGSNNVVIIAIGAVAVVAVGAVAFIITKKKSAK